MSLKKTLLKQSAQYSLGTFLALFASVARAGVGARVLPPSEMGFWIAVQVLVGYLANLHLGTAFGMFRSVPLLLGRGESQAASEELRTAWTFIMGMAIAVCALGLPLGKHVLPEASTSAVALSNLFAFFTIAKTFYVSAFKAERRFRELSIANAMSSFAGLLAVLAVPSYGLSALLMSAVLQNGIETAVLAAYRGRPEIGISRPILIAQLRVGLLTLLSNLGVVAISSVDRAVMLRMLGTSAAGLFSLGAQISIMMPLVAGVPLAVLTPVFFERVGKGEDLMPLVDRATSLIACGFSWVLTITAFCLAPAMSHVWPQMVPSVLACKLSLLGTFPYVLVGPISNVFYAVNRQGPQIVIMFFSAAFMFGAAWLGVRLTGTIAGAAGGAALGMYVYFAATSLRVFRFFDLPGRAFGRFMVRTLGPGLYAAGASLVVDVVLARWLAEASILRGLASIGLVTLLMLPFLRHAVRIVRP